MKQLIITMAVLGLLFSGPVIAAEMTGTLSNNPEYTQTAVATDTTTQFPSSTSQVAPAQSFNIWLMVKILLVTGLVLEVVALVFVRRRRRKFIVETN